MRLESIRLSDHTADHVPRIPAVSLVSGRPGSGCEFGNSVNWKAA